MELFEIVKSLLPKEILLAIIFVCIACSLTVKIIETWEEDLEFKYKKEFKIFDHKKIWINVFWSAAFILTLAVAEVIRWKEVFMYMLDVIGGSTFFYEIIIKKKGGKNEETKGNIN